MTNLADNSIGELFTDKATKTQECVYCVSSSKMNVKVCICDIRHTNQVNMGTNELIYTCNEVVIPK